MKQYAFNQPNRFHTLWEMVAYNASHYPNQVAFQYVENNVVIEKTFLDFQQDVSKITRFLKLCTSKKAISLIGPNSYYYLVSWFAITSSGNYVVPLDAERRNSDLDSLIQDSKCIIVIYDVTLQNYIDNLKVSLTNPVQFVSMTEIANRINTLEIVNIPFDQKYAVAGEDIAALYYTSGTTSNSKGVLLSHNNLCADVYGSCQNFNMKRKAFHVLPWHHVYGMIGLLCSFSEGAVSAICSNQKKLLTELQLFRPKILIVVPLYVESLYKVIKMTIKKQQLDEEFEKKLSFSRSEEQKGNDIRKETFQFIRRVLSEKLETIISGGAPLDIQHVRFFHNIGIEVRDGYGITECAAVVTVNRDYYYKEGSVGIPIPICQVKILNEKDGIGEVIVKGENVMLGYYNNTQANLNSFTDGWYKTGDLGYFDEDGFLFLKGRVKNLIIGKNGENVCPEELEALIQQIPEVKEVVVFLSDKQYIAAEIFPDMEYVFGNEIDDYKDVIKTKITALNRTLPPYKVIAEVLFRTEEFRKNSSKKIIRT